MPSLFDRLLAASLPAVPKPIVRRISGRYIAGEGIDDALAVARKLMDRGLSSTMDILGEHCDSAELADAAAGEYLELLDRQAAAGVDCNVSIKLSQLGLIENRETCLLRLRKVASRTTELDGKLRIDMEDSGLTDDTLWVFRKLREDFERVGVVIQAYLHRSLDDVSAMAALRPDYRLCKGIYVESPDLAIQEAAEINRNYLELLGAMWDGGSFVGIATHDAALIAAVQEMIAERGLGPDRYEFQMLLGVQEKLRDGLIAAGHPLRVYLPFGREWYAYSMRRLKENPSIAGHVFRQFLGLD
jgi:proline dehydrogenase